MKSDVLIGHAEVLAQVLFYFCPRSTDVTFIGGNQNVVYELKQDEKSYILRLTPVTNRSESLVQSELDWIIFLANKGILVSKPILSLNGRLTETIYVSDECYTCVVFEKALGRAVGYPECLQDHTLYINLGRLTGKLHAYSNMYQPRKDIIERHDWNNNWFIQNLDLLPQSQIGVRESLHKLKKQIHQLPKDKHVYGLIHGDIGVGNFRVDEKGDITLFDFDEAQHSWFVEDIAIQLYYLVYVYGGADGEALREEQTHRFISYFMKGYNLEYSLDDYWIKQIPLFLRLREIIVYIGCFRNWDGDEKFSSSDNQWFKDWIAESKERIEKDKSIVDIWS